MHTCHVQLTAYSLLTPSTQCDVVLWRCGAVVHAGLPCLLATAASTPAPAPFTALGATFCSLAPLAAFRALGAARAASLLATPAALLLLPWLSFAGTGEHSRDGFAANYALH